MLYAPSNPLTAEPPDLSAIIDRFAEGDLSDMEPDQYSTPDHAYQGITGQAARGSGSNDPAALIGPDGFVQGRAAEFATPSDLANYRRTGSLLTGDNGVGAWGDFTAGSRPGVAVPRDLLAHVYGSEDAARGKNVLIIAPNGTQQVVPILDKGPKLANRQNDAVIEVNPAAKALLGTGDSNGYRYQLLP